MSFRTLLVLLFTIVLSSCDSWPVSNTKYQVQKSSFDEACIRHAIDKTQGIKFKEKSSKGFRYALNPDTKVSYLAWVYVNKNEKSKSNTVELVNFVRGKGFSSHGHKINNPIFDAGKRLDQNLQKYCSNIVVLSKL